MPETSFGLSEAQAHAARVHEGQVDKAGLAYIAHPLRVMARVEGDEAKMAAVLHDTVEDTATSLEELRALGCPEPVVRAVDALTKRVGETLESSMARVAADPIARAVKLADIDDNTDPERLARLDEATRSRLLAKYERSLQLLA